MTQKEHAIDTIISDAFRGKLRPQLGTGVVLDCVNNPGRILLEANHELLIALGSAIAGEFFALYPKPNLKQFLLLLKARQNWYSVRERGSDPTVEGKKIELCDGMDQRFRNRVQVIIDIVAYYEAEK